MPAGRPTTPLFELLSRGQTSAPSGREARPVLEPEPAPRPQKPVVRVELKPREITPEPEPAQTGKLLAAIMGGTSIRIPVNAVYFATASVILLMLVVWLGGMKFGATQERRDFEAFHNRDAPVITEPLESPAAVPSRSGAAQPVKAVASTPVKPAVQPQAKPRQPLITDPWQAVITSKGMLVGDPREIDLNYLALVNLPKADTEAAIAFLASNGVEAFGVPVDPKSPAAKNAAPPTVYRLYVLPGITADDFRQGKSVKSRIEAEVARLGQVWRKDHRGASDFRSPGWEKFKG